MHGNTLRITCIPIVFRTLLETLSPHTFEFLTTFKTFYITEHMATVAYSVMIEAICIALWSIRTCRSPQSKNPVCLLRPDRKNVNNIITHPRHGDYIESLISRDVSEVFQFNFTSITVHGITSDNSAYSNTGYSMRDKHAVKQDQKAVLQSAREIHSEIRYSHR